MFIQRLLLLLAVCEAVTCTRYGQFRGGTINCEVKWNTVTQKPEAHLDVLSGWSLGHGPCGTSCTRADVGMDTLTNRKAVEITHNDPFYFGNWSTDSIFYKKDSIVNVVTDEMKRNMKESVFSVSEVGKWEQDRTTAVVDLIDTDSRTVIMFEGQSWPTLPLQKRWRSSWWTLRSSVHTGNRSDTGKPNTTPMTLIRPVYRIKLNSVLEIKIPAADNDGDLVKCDLAHHVEGGSLSGNQLPGLVVNEDCTISINTSTSLNYTDGSLGGVALVLRDFNRHDIIESGDHLVPYAYSMGKTPCQFSVEVLDNLYQPEFISPTFASSHHFYLYPGTMLRVDIYAVSTANRTVDRFDVLGRQNEVASLSPIKDDPTGRERVKYTTLTWTPEQHDTNSHIICVRAVDDYGVYSADDRCFIVTPTGVEFNSSQIQTSHKPFLVDLPSDKDGLKWMKDSTYVLPIFVRSSDKVTSIIAQSSAAMMTKSEIERVYHDGAPVYTTDVSFTFTVDGVHDLCFSATDVHGSSSDRVCVQIEILPPDPCESAPCRNGGKCSRSRSNSSDYVCKCTESGVYGGVYGGRNCDEVQMHVCDPNPCLHGRCIDGRWRFYCYCPPGYTGTTCEINTNDCKRDSCNGHGICMDMVNAYRCACFERYSGTDCDTDMCPAALTNQVSCSGGPPPGCGSNQCPHGRCVSGGRCVCPLAYSSDSHCSQEIGDLKWKFTKVAITPPTIADQATIVCYRGDNCDVMLYIASPDRTTPRTRVDNGSTDPELNVTIVQPYIWTGMEGIQNMYRSEVSVSSSTLGQRTICLIAYDVNSMDRRCFNLTWISDPRTNNKSAEYQQANASIQFLAPTPRGETQFLCTSDTRYHLLLYSTLPSSGKCERILSSDDRVVVFDPTVTMSGACQTEITYKFTPLGHQYICFQASANIMQSQKRCFNFSVQEKVTEDCSSSPCTNGGSCESLPGTFTCHCPPGYRGRYCEQDQNECLYSPCQHGATCVNLQDGFSCSCPSGYTGERCETQTDCHVIDSYPCWQLVSLRMCSRHVTDQCVKTKCDSCELERAQQNLIG